MAKLIYGNGITSVVLRVKIADTRYADNRGLTGLTFESAGLIISTIADNEATATAYTVTGGTIETISTLGTFAAPTATKCRFKEVDATNHPGVYEIQIADARWSVTDARSVIVSVLGAANAAQVDAEIQLDPVPADVLKVKGADAGAAGVIDANITQINGSETIDTYTPEEIVSLIAAALLGKCSGADSNAPVYRSADDSADRISATTDADGNRSAVTLTPVS